MIKRLLATLFPLVFMPYMIFAISLGTIQKNPSQYKKVFEDAAWTTYVDTNSIESLRYSPPYYTLKAKFYNISYSEEDEKIKLIIQSIYKNSGMTCCINKAHVWTLDGSAVGTTSPYRRAKCEPRGIFYKLGSYIFLKHYNKPFGISTMK